MDPGPHPRLTLGATVATSAGTLVLGYCDELDERARSADPEAEPATHIMRWTGDRLAAVGRHPWRLETVRRLQDGSVLGVGRAPGSVRIRGGAFEPLAEVHPGTCNGLWEAPDGVVHMVGSYAPFWRRLGPGGWTDLPLPPGAGGLSAVIGDGAGEVYAVGMGGTVLRWDGASVTAVATPAAGWLTSAVRVPAGICIGGHRGMLLVGGQQGWRRIDSGTTAPLLNLVEHDGGVCFATPDGVRWVDPVQGGSRMLCAQPCRWLAAFGDGLLLVQGSQAWVLGAGGLRPVDTSV